MYKLIIWFGILVTVTVADFPLSTESKCVEGTKFRKSSTDGFVRKCGTDDDGDKYSEIVGCYYKNEKKLVPLNGTVDIYKCPTDIYGFRYLCKQILNGDKFEYTFRVIACTLKGAQALFPGQSGAVSGMTCTCFRTPEWTVKCKA